MLAELQLVARGHQLQAVAGIAQTGAGTAGLTGATGWRGITNLQLPAGRFPGPVDAACYADHSTLRALGNTMFHGIFNQCQQA